MIKILVEDKAKRVEIASKGTLIDITADFLTGLSCFYEEMYDNSGKEEADLFIEMIGKNLEMVKIRKKMSEVQEDVDKKKKKEVEDEFISELDKLLKDLKELREDIVKEGESDDKE